MNNSVSHHAISRQTVIILQDQYALASSMNIYHALITCPQVMRDKISA